MAGLQETFNRAARGERDEEILSLMEEFNRAAARPEKKPKGPDHDWGGGSGGGSAPAGAMTKTPDDEKKKKPQVGREKTPPRI